MPEKQQYFRKITPKKNEENGEIMEDNHKVGRTADNEIMFGKALVQQIKL